MPRSQILAPPQTPTRGLGIPEFGESFDTIAARFDQHGALGLLQLRCPDLAGIEQEYGNDARLAVYGRLSAIARGLSEHHLDIDDIAVSGEPGFDEILVLVFREHVDARFYREELPSFERAFRKELDGRGPKILYPYARRSARVVSGVAAALRNPKLSVETQIRTALDEAREDADLNARSEARARRRRILDVVLDRQITSVYEPIVTVESKTVHGYEALARGPAGTDLYPPLVLFGLAEEEGLVFELDCLCRASGLKGAVGLPGGTQLFLNIRPTTIHDPNFRAERLIRTLHECELSPSDVVFEVSEQESISNFEAFKEIRDYYRDLGFRFALDDTGAGYAGLEALVEISPDYIKVDRSFVSGVDLDPVRRTMLGALQTVAEKTGAQLIAEGLDTLEELETLEELGIPFGQGWLFGKPTPLRAQER
jgi:EAL domain-containing protein (putative c-di-GMP-specific phosphodiesterase class I)